LAFESAYFGAAFINAKAFMRNSIILNSRIIIIYSTEKRIGNHTTFSLNNESVG